MNDFDILYKRFNNKNNIHEASSDFKGKLLNSKKTKAFFYWEWKLKPATIDIDFGYRITFDIKKIKKDFLTSEGKTDWEEFHKSIIKPNLSERAIHRLANKLSMPGFNVLFVTYNSEFTIDSLDPSRKDKYYFSHTLTFEAKDGRRNYTRNEIIDLCQSYVNKFEKIAFGDNYYYKITKT